MRRASRRPAVLVLLAMVASLLGVIAPTAAQAAESIPTLQWPPAQVGDGSTIVTGPSGSTTVGCRSDSSNQSRNNDLQTIDSAGQIVQDIPRTDTIDGAPNCIMAPAVDKNGAVYGFPQGLIGGSWVDGPNLLAYSGNTLKWKYPASCGSSGYPPVVGADGNVYTLNRLSNGQTHLIGLAPELEGGQIQPTKVLDVVVSGNCSTEMFAYKGGLMLHGSSVRFYSYAGQFLGQVSANNEKINADGKLFYPSFMTTTNGRSGSVEMFDASRGEVKWTTAVSTPGANVNGLTVYPLPGGGVVALIQEQKMLTGGIPASPTEWVYTLATINPAGLKVSSVTLLNTGANIVYGNTRVSADTGGKLAVARAVAQTVTTATGSTKVVPAISLAVYNPVDSTWSNQMLMTGDALKSGGPNGYDLFDGPYLTNNTLLFRASCSGNCTDTITRLYAAQVSGLGMEHPRGAVLATPPLKPYVALGDSYSSGQGASDYDSGTVTSTNSCYKSYNAYGRVLNRDPASPLLLTNFAACGGSKTEHIDQSGTYSGVPLQDTALTSTTQVVSLTIGGNDIGFVDVVYGCLQLQCDAAIQTARQKLADLPTKLNRVYGDILSKTSAANGGANAQVYVLGFGPLLSEDAPDCTIGDAPFGGTNRTKAIALLNDLNQAISDAVTATGSSRIHYVDPTETDSPFLGHSLCTSDPYFNPIIPSNTSESFHPNIKGQEAYAKLLADHVS